MTAELTRTAFLRGAAGFGCVLAIGETTVAQRSEEKMQTRPIPSSGKPLPVIGVGTWQTFDVGASPAERAPLAEVLRVLFEAGGSAIDSSPMYGKAEGVVGDLLAIFLGFAAGLNQRLMSVGTVVFSSTFSPSALAYGIVVALLIGIAGGLMPAWRAANLPIVESLREA